MDLPYEPYLEMLPRLKPRFEAARSCYEQLRDSIRPQIRGWEWASYPRHELKPFEMLILGHPKPGRVIKSEPLSKNGKFRHGYNGADRVVLTEQYTEFEGQFYETYVEYTEDHVDSVLHDYSARKECINVSTLLLENGKPIASLAYGERGQSATVYEYEQDRIVRFWEINQGHDQKSGAGKLMVFENLVTYQDGSVESIERRGGFGGREMILKDGRRRSLPGNL
jgi:hypothetical protein